MQCAALFKQREVWLLWLHETANGHLMDHGQAW